MTAGAQHRVLVCGAGSIGQRHIRNLAGLGVKQIAAVDPEPEMLAAVRESVSATYKDLSSGLREFRPTAVFVCSPPVHHVAQAEEGLAAGAHLFIEKPLACAAEGVARLRQSAAGSGLTVQVGYNLRFHPGVEKLKALVEGGTLGRVLWMRAEAGQYLPDWRPGRDYRRSYSARRELGGGIVLDASHEIDYALWLLGAPRELVCMAGKVSGLEVDVEDCATLLLRFASGAQADIHVDFVRRGYQRGCTIVGENGTAEWDYSVGQVRVQRAGQRDWEIMAYSFAPNDMYIAEARHFLECVEQGGAPRAGLGDGIAALEVALAALRSAAERTWVSLG